MVVRDPEWQVDIVHLLNYWQCLFEQLKRFDQSASIESCAGAAETLG
jgi:hypothetical protein